MASLGLDRTLLSLECRSTALKVREAGEAARNLHPAIQNESYFPRKKMATPYS